MKENPYPRARSGVLMGLGAIVLWSTASASVVFGERQVGVWQFLSLTTLMAGVLQIIAYVALRRPLRSILLPPLKIWLGILLGFILYLFALFEAIATSSTDTQRVGVSLMNYLWPTLTILFATFCVRTERLSPRLISAIVISLAGVLLANWRDIVALDSGDSIWPYVLGLAAAVFWAAYSALTSRWRDWAKDYAAAPMGFLTVGCLAAGICSWQQEWQPMSEAAWWTVSLSALFPWAGGYMLWELALHREAGPKLGLIATATPVLSTAFLLVLLELTSKGSVYGTQGLTLFAASCLIGIAVALGRRPDGNQERSG